MKTMLDKVAVAGDITQALDRRGVATVAITVIGGTESTAVKLQSCDTADGSFTDFKELIPVSGATADQYKGFVVDLYGAGKFIKVVGATMATAVFGDCDYDVKKVAIKAGEIPSGADLENNKTATIDVSTYTEPVEIEPTEGKDGMKKATVTLSNIPEIEANKAQTIDVSTYTEPVEIEPTAGKSGMAKVTVTLGNFPSGSATAYAWAMVNAPNDTIFTNFDKAPSDKATLLVQNQLAFGYNNDNRVQEIRKRLMSDFLPAEFEYAKVSDTEYTMNVGGNILTIQRNLSRDVTLW